MTTPTDRQAWLQERRAAVEAQYDTEAAEYDQYPYDTTMHREFVQQLLETCPSGGIVLDAPCGTGPYFELVKASGREVVGVDGSTGMLGQARGRGLAIRLEHVALQDLAFEAEFDGSMTIDAMENIPPEEWPLVLANLHRAVRPGAHVYLTVEEIDQSEIDAAFRDSRAKGLPAIHGEVIEGDSAGYHYYPSREQVLAWIAAEGLTVAREELGRVQDWDYRHLLLRSRG